MIFALLLATQLSMAEPSPHRKAVAQTANRFDLVCDMHKMSNGEPDSTVHYHLDMSRPAWCDDGAVKCDSPHALGVSASAIVFRNENNNTQYGSELHTEILDRSNGVLTIDEEVAGTDMSLKGTCQKRPFMTSGHPAI